MATTKNKSTEILHITSAALPYLLSVPSAAGQGPWPVLTFLHGLDEAAPCPIREAVTRHGPLNAKNPARIRDEFIVVAPQMPRGGDLWHRFSDTVKEITTEVQKKYDGDHNRTYLSGFSYGGNGVFDLAVEQLGFWAGLWPVDPTRVPQKPIERPIWISIGQASRRLTNDYIKKLNVKPLDEGLGGDRYFLDENLDHCGCAASAYRDERIYDWLLAKRLH